MTVPVDRDSLICDQCGHLASEHYSPVHGYARCGAAGCSCDWFSCELKTWENSK